MAVDRWIPGVERPVVIDGRVRRSGRCLAAWSDETTRRSQKLRHAEERVFRDRGTACGVLSAHLNSASVGVARTVNVARQGLQRHVGRCSARWRIASRPDVRAPSAEPRRVDPEEARAPPKQASMRVQHPSMPPEHARMPHREASMPPEDPSLPLQEARVPPEQAREEHGEAREHPEDACEAVAEPGVPVGQGREAVATVRERQARHPAQRGHTEEEDDGSS